MNRIFSWGELRLAVRLILKQPVLSITVVLALATGICVSTIGFTFREEMVNSVLPYEAGPRFARIYVLDRGDRGELDLDRYRALRDAATSFEHVGAMASRPFTVKHADGEVEPIRGAIITARSMKWIDAVPLIGRSLIPSDSDAGAERVVVIGEQLWRKRYSADPSIIGKQLSIGAQPHTVVGVMPEAFKFPNSEDMWMAADESTLSGVIDTPSQRVFGVLRPGVSFQTADAEASTLMPPMSTGAGGEGEGRMMVRRFTAEPDGANVALAAVVFMLVMVLLLIASNVATLIFARTWSRAPELATRAALGAGRGRIVSQLFLEMLVLSSIAAAVGLSAAYAVLRFIREKMDTDVGFWHTLTPTPSTLLFVIGLTLLVGVVSGLLPALRVTRHDLRNTLQAGRGFAFGGFGKAGAAMLIIEIALSVGLLNGAVTVARAFSAYVQDVPALPQHQVLTAQLGRIETVEQRNSIVEAARSLPGVIVAGAGQILPRQFPLPRLTAVEPVGDEPVQAAMPAPSAAVDNGFLDAIGGRALAGRPLVPADFTAGAAPVAVVNDLFVQKFFGGRNPIGRRIRVEKPREDGSQEPWREVVGVVPDLGLSVANPATAAGFYYPKTDETLWYLAIRTAGDPMQLAPRLRAAVANIDPDAQLEEIQPLENAGADERTFLSGVATALTAIGGIALMLSIVAIYALLSFMVTRRTREIGIRMALGATSRQVLQTVTGAAMLYLGIGGLAGTGIGYLSLQLRDVLLVSIPDAGAWVPLTVFGTLALAGLIACWVPARRALGIKPAEALNAD